MRVYPHTKNLQTRKAHQKSRAFGEGVYLDYAATTPVKKEVLEAMLSYLRETFGNPSSIHTWGQVARRAIDNARQTIADFLGCSSAEIIFTSGGTEADNLAIKGIIESSKTDERPHIITSKIEHHAVLKTCQDLEKKGLATITYIRPNKEGIIEVDKIQKAIKSNTILVPLMYVNNEIGTIQPIREIGKLIEKENRNRQPFSRIFFHTDAVQAAEFFPMKVDFLHVDMLTISGHKIGAPKGIGALYIRKGTPIKSLIHGGEQELGLRAGTENVAGIVGLGKAIEIIQNAKFKNQNDNAKLKNLRDYFIEKVIKEIPEVELNGSREFRSPNNANLYFKYVEGESIVLAMDLEGVACSTGSACTSQSLEPSHVIMAVFEDPKRAAGSVRFSLGEEITKKELDYTVSKLKKVIKRLREISPYGGK